MGFLERLNALIKEKEITKKQFLEDCGFGKNSFDNWKKSKGGMPTLPFCRIIADYFDVSVEYVMCETDDRGTKKEPAASSEFSELSPAKQQLLSLVDTLSDEQCRKLAGIIEEAKKLL